MAIAIEIRPARAEDADPVTELIGQLGYPLNADAVRVVLAAMGGGAGHAALVAVEPEGSVVGLIAISSRPALRLGGWIGSVEELIVRHGARSRGVGSRLLQHAKGLAAQRGWKRVEASVARRRESHRRGFLFSRGFVAADSTTFRWAALEGRYPAWPDLGAGAQALRGRAETGPPAQPDSGRVTETSSRAAQARHTGGACWVAMGSATPTDRGASDRLATMRRPGAARRRADAAGRADLHVHSLWSDGAQPPEDIVRAAAGRLDVVAITDHDAIRGALLARAFAQAHPDLGVDVVVGEEISTRNGHLIGLWLEAAVPPGLDARDAIERIHDQGGLAVVAHPFHPLRGVARGHRPIGRLVPDLLLDVEWQLPVTAGSDAHDVWYLGSAVTRFPGRDARALRRALIAGRTRAERRWSWSFDKLPRHLSVQSRSLVRFLRLVRMRRAAQCTG